MFPALWKFGLQLLPWTSNFSTVTVPASCFTRLTVADLADCLDGYTVPKEFYTRASYDRAQPTAEQRLSWRDVVNRLLSVDDITCATVSVPSALVGIYAIRRFRDYCVLYETTTTGGFYDKGWGFMVVPSLKSRITRRLHISAPHPKFDDGTVEQAAAIFQSTGSHSLLVAGRHRNAFFEISGCIPSHNITDPAHNTAEPFFIALVIIHRWQNGVDGCPTPSCAFIQLHGNKGCDQDPTLTVFLSAGLDLNQIGTQIPSTDQ